MATISFILQSKSESANIYLRLSVDRKTVIRRKTNFVINSSDWSTKKSQPLDRDENLKVLKTNLDKLRTGILERLNDATKKSVEINGDWLTTQIDEIQGRATIDEKESSKLVNMFDYYISNLPNKVYSNGKKGASESTIRKYTTIKNKLIEFQKLKKKTIHVKDVDLKFRNDFIKFLADVHKINDNTIGRYIKFLKTVCIDARDNTGIEASPQLNRFKGYSNKVEKIFLTLDEIETIKDTTYKRDALNNAKDWLIIGCFIGQRVSDLLTLTRNNIAIRNGVEMIEITQKKTGKKVSIPLHHEVKTILDNRNGDFPTKISAVHFNLHIKDICQLAGITQPTPGGKIDRDTSRKIEGVFPKWQLVTSHICRRSFASNFYGDIPTALLISITGHSTERQFLEYIGKNPTDYATQLAEYWQKQAQMAKKEPVLEVVKKAN